MDPQIKVTEDNELFKFTISKINVSLANALRRIILSEIPCVVIRTETHDINDCNIISNTCRLHNEIIKQRLSCIPIHMDFDQLEDLPGKYKLEIDMKNNEDHMIYVTTEDFKIRNKINGHLLPSDATKKIFPPSEFGYYIDFVRLKPKISDTILGEELKLEAEFSISNAKVNSMFNVVSKCAYSNTPNLIEIDKTWKDKEAVLSKDFSKEEIEFQKKNFYILDAQRIFVENSFDFVIKTVGVYKNNEIVKKGCEILYSKFENIIKSIDNGIINVLYSDTTIEHCFDIHLEDEDYTIGKVLEYILYTNYYEKDNKLSFCGFKKLHPHDNFSIIRIAFNEKNDKNMCLQFLRNAAEDAVSIYKKLYKLL